MDGLVVRYQWGNYLEISASRHGVVPFGDSLPMQERSCATLIEVIRAAHAQHVHIRETREALSEEQIQRLLGKEPTDAAAGN